MTNFGLNPSTELYKHTYTSVGSGYNNLAASIFGFKPIRPTAITIPIHHKALQAMIWRQVNLDTWMTLQSVNKVALLTITNGKFLNEQQYATMTHFTMTQYGFKKALSLDTGQAEVAASKELKQLHSHDVFAPQDITQIT